MNIRKALALGAGLATAATMLVVAAPAHAVENGNTNVTFTLSNGALSVQVTGSTASTAATKNLGTVTPDSITSQIGGDLLSTTVTDSRNTLAGYTVSANCDNFVDGASHSIANTLATVSIPSVTSGNLGGAALTGSNLTNFFVPSVGTPCGPVAGAIGAKATILSSLLTTLGVVSATNTVTYTPHITVTIPPGTVDGTYSSVVYQTAA